MSVTLYDESLSKKIEFWLGVPGLRVMRPSETAEMFGMKSDLNMDKPLTLPLVSLSRNSDIELSYPHKKPSSFDGLMLDAIGDIDEELIKRIKENPEKYPNWSIKKGSAKDTYSLQLNAIPMSLRYQLDIYTRRAEEGNDFMRGLIFNFVNDPLGIIELPYHKTKFIHSFIVYVDSTVSDNSDIPQRLFNDQFTRWTIGLSIPHAYLFDVHKYELLSSELILETE